MIDIKDFIETENINKTVLSDSLGITRTTLYTWLEEKRPEKIEKIIKAINHLAAEPLQCSNCGVKGWLFYSLKGIISIGVIHFIFANNISY